MTIRATSITVVSLLRVLRAPATATRTSITGQGIAVKADSTRSRIQRVAVEMASKTSPKVTSSHETSLLTQFARGMSICSGNSFHMRCSVPCVRLARVGRRSFVRFDVVCQRLQEGVLGDLPHEPSRVIDHAEGVAGLEGQRDEVG